MTRRRQAMAVLAAVATAAPISACGSNATDQTTVGTKPADRTQQALKFSACMRSHGVGQFPDPDGSGDLTIDQVVNGSSIDPRSSAFTQALGACKSLEPAGFTGGRRSSTQQAAALKFAQCIRSNGVKDFPDPVNGQPLVDTDHIPSANAPGGITILNAAMRACATLGAAARGQS